MDRVEVSLTLKLDRSGATLTMKSAGKEIAGDLDGAEVEALIENLMRMRASMADEVPRELEPHIRMQPIADPVWRVPTQPGPMGKRLGLRHPGLGWLWFEFPQAESEAIGQSLLK